jgi:hypothetical protein
MKERLLLYGIALYSAHVSPGDVERPAAIEANFADAGLSFRDRATVSAGVTAHPVSIERLDEVGVGLSNALIQDVA